MAAKKLFYIGRIINPKFGKSYYNAYGKLTKAEAKRKEDCVNGGVTFETKDAYFNALKNLKEQGFSVHIQQDFI